LAILKPTDPGLTQLGLVGVFFVANQDTSFSATGVFIPQSPLADCFSLTLRPLTWGERSFHLIRQGVRATQGKPISFCAYTSKVSMARTWSEARIGGGTRASLHAHRQKFQGGRFLLWTPRRFNFQGLDGKPRRMCSTVRGELSFLYDHAIPLWPHA